MKAKFIYKNPKTGFLIFPEEISGQIPLKVVSVSANYQMSEDDDIVLVDATAGAITVTLPRVTRSTGKVKRIKKIDSGGNAVTVSPFSSATIDGASTLSITTQYQVGSVMSDGSNWQVVVSASSAFNGGSITTAMTINVSSATALVIGPNGTTNPVLKVITNVASQSAGVSITGNASGNGAVIAAISGGATEDLWLTAKASTNQLIIRDTRSSGAFALLSASATDTITGNVTDGFTSALSMSPTINGAFTVTRLNYINMANVAGSSTVTNACAIRFDAAAGTHKAVDSGSTKTTPGGVDAWVKVNIAGTIYYIPAYTSKTA